MFKRLFLKLSISYNSVTNVAYQRYLLLSISINSYIHRVFQVTSNNDIHYLLHCSLVYLIHQNYDVVCHNFYADGNIIISVSFVKSVYFSPFSAVKNSPKSPV